MSPTSDYLDELLDRSAPRTTVMTGSVADALTRLRVATSVETENASLRRPVIAGLTFVLLLGDAATATAAATNSWLLRAPTSPSTPTDQPNQPATGRCTTTRTKTTSGRCR